MLSRTVVVNVASVIFGNDIVDITKWFKDTEGVRQGCILSPKHDCKFVNPKTLCFLMVAATELKLKEGETINYQLNNLNFHGDYIY